MLFQEALRTFLELALLFVTAISSNRRIRRHDDVSRCSAHRNFRGDTAELNRLFNPVTGDHMLTPSKLEVGSAVQPIPGYRFEKSLGLVAIDGKTSFCPCLQVRTAQIFFFGAIKLCSTQYATK